MKKWALLFLLVPLAVRAASPILNVIYPPGGQRGAELDVTLYGQHLSDAGGLLFYAPGIELESLKVQKDSVLAAKFRVAPDCPLGSHQLRLRTASGISNLMLFQVGPFPNVQEQKPDGDPAHAQSIPLNSTVNGLINDEQIAYFSVNAKKGERLTAEVEGMRLGIEIFDPWVAIEDAKGRELASDDDSSLFVQDPLASILAPADGTYLFAVRESTWGGGDRAYFRLHAGAFPQPRAVYPLGGQAGQTLAVQFIGDPGGPINQAIKLPPQTCDDYPLFAEQDGLTAPGANPIRVSWFPNVLEAAPNNDIAHATVADKPLPLAFNGIISARGQKGFFKFKAAKDAELDINVFARRLRSPLDSVLAIYKSDGSQIAENDDSAGLDSYLHFKVPADGDYYLSVRDQLGRGGPDFTYRVEVVPSGPYVSITIPEIVRNSQERQTIVIPEGNRYATIFRVQHYNTDAKPVLEVAGLPAGVTFTAGDPQGDVVPVVFEAAPDAALSGTLCSLANHDVDSSKPIPTGYDQTVDLIHSSPNDSVYLSTSVNKLAVSVADPAPFKVEIAQPKMILPQQAAVDLPVVVTREPGFNAPITVSLLQNPPGISSQGSITIPEGQTTATIPVNASDEAKLHDWQIAAIATADPGTGAVWVASHFATLTVEQPLVTAQIERADTEQGHPVAVVCDLTQNIPFDGKATARLLGLPSKASAPDCEITSADHQIHFNVSVDPGTPAGRHHDLFCQITFPNGGHQIVESTGQGGVLRVETPSDNKEMASK